ncbi:hypothetical protein KHQ89_05580 [Mycoplasmatota bacterium]|nr:hypothetical protein KHQ89_05580 [Mycoplasmatota bacterium]
MKNIQYIKVMIICVLMLALVSCTSTTETPYEPNVPEYNYIPEGKTSFEVSDIESGSALLTFDEKERVSHYEIKVSNYSDFQSDFTKTLISKESSYRLYFNDNSQIYVMAKAIAENGKSYDVSDVKTIVSPYANLVVGDDFSLGAIDDWTTINANISSDYHSLIVSPDGTSSELTIKKTFEVNLDLAEILEIKWITKNTNSKISAFMTIDEVRYDIVLDMSVISRGYVRFNLNELNMTGSKDIEITIMSEEGNIGFQLDYIRFIYESEHQLISDFQSIDKTNEFNTISLNNGYLNIQNDLEPSVISTPSSEVDFDPNELSILELYLSGYYPRDTIKLTISNSLDEQLYISDVMYITNYDGYFTFDLLALNITEDDTYTISYEISNEEVVIDMMQLIGESDNELIPVVYGQWIDGYSAYMTENDTIKLKSSTIYNYGDVRQTVTVDLGQTPIVFFDVAELFGAWSVKVVPEGAVSDIPVTSLAESQTGKSAYDLSQVLQSSDVTTFTFVIFVIGGYAGDQSAMLKMNPITFGNALSVISNTSDEVTSTVEYDMTTINVTDFRYIYIRVSEISKDAQWKLYLIDKNTNRRFEMKTSLEKKYTQRYNRSKVGFYIYDIYDITGFTGEMTFGLMIQVIGNDATVNIQDINFTTNNNIPNHIVSVY